MSAPTKDQTAPEREEPLRFSLRDGFVFVTVCCVLLAAGIGLVRYMGPIIPLSVEAQLTPGMSQSQVRELLGEPNEIEESRWVYTRSANPGWCSIYWDDSEKLSYVDNEWP
ncbi:hypothetical protein KOR34_50070 [Posidoniimonas corsicana]|uniref:Outer membrane protein assembly factor BamE domain-containing protein n=1 Tax=Posidoniimonas corsicana TaxID=1938618 RepID=A0A5C5UW98_9BACT|nr:outer membrane protein assembly factor BamE [Posidoniimonas corsicana]TWT30448.1 hypothetical protein KOR34_50070 [Posidoniimonas corsicana]